MTGRLTRTLRFDPDPPGTPLLRVTFLVLWSIDLVGAMLFFRVPYAAEVNPVTVLCHRVAGAPGVALAAASYAGVVVVVGQILSDPWDRRFVYAVSVLYAVLAVNNVPLLLFGEAVLDPFA